MLEENSPQSGNHTDSIKKLNSNIRKLYLYWFFHSLIFAYVIERLFGLERGLSIQQMIYIEIIYAVVVMLLEIPTGVLADKWSRKKSMILSSVFNFFEIFILIFAYDFRSFALSAVSAAIGGALASGTGNAIFYDTLKSLGKETEFEKVIGRNNFYSSISGLIAALFGSIIASNFGYTSAYTLSLIGVTVSIFIIFTLYEPKTTLKTKENEYCHESEESSFDFRKAVQFLKENESVRFIMLYAIITGGTINYVDEYWQVYLQKIGIPVSAFGIYSVLHSIILSITGVFAYKLRKRFGYKLIFSVCIVFTGLGLVFCSFVNTHFGLISLLATFFFFGLTEPLSLGFIHHRTDSVHRATIESFFSFALKMVIIIIGLLFGYICNLFSIFPGFRFLGLIILGYAIYFLIFEFRYIMSEEE